MHRFSTDSDAQIFNRIDLREKIKDGTLGLPAPEHLVGRFVLLLSFALLPYMVIPHNRRQLTWEERIANYRISRGRSGVETAFEILESQFRVLLGTSKSQGVVRNIMFMCVVLHHMLRIHQGGADRAPTPANDVVAKMNRRCMYQMKITGILRRRPNINETY